MPKQQQPNGTPSKKPPAIGTESYLRVIFHVIQETGLWAGCYPCDASRGMNADFACTNPNHLRGTPQMKSLTTVVLGSTASVLILNGFAFAQQQSQQQQQYQQGPTQQLTVREARQFISGIERDINQMVQTGNLSRLRQWTQNNIADNAVFNRTNSIETEGQSRAVASMTITTTWTCWSILALRPAI